MEPNRYGFIRNRNLDLIATGYMLATMDLFHLSELHAELIPVEYVDSTLIDVSGITQASATYKSGWVDISEYDYVLVPVNIIGIGSPAPFIGTAPSIGGNITGQYARGTNMYGWLLYTVSTATPYLAITSLQNTPDELCMPIGFKRHRSDGVNPLGIINPLNHGLLQGLDDPDADINPVDPDPEEEA